MYRDRFGAFLYYKGEIIWLYNHNRRRVFVTISILFSNIVVSFEMLCSIVADVSMNNGGINWACKKTIEVCSGCYSRFPEGNR